MTTSPDRQPITAPILGQFELVACVSQLVSIISDSPSDTIFGEKIKYADNIAEAMRLVLERKAPMLVERLVSDRPDDKDVFDIRYMIFNEANLRDELECRLKSATLANGTNWDTLTSFTSADNSTIEIEGCYTVPPPVL